MLAVAVAVAAAPLVPAMGPADAAAAACSSATGVTAVVDFNELGGGVTAGCDGDGGGRPASEVFRDAGYQLQYSQQPGMNGFVCKVQGQPADGDCAQNDQFWSLWWSDGRSGRWVFANEGVGSLDVPDGGYVAFSWHQGSGEAAPPDANPTPHPEPAQPETSTGQGGSGGNDGGGGRGDDPADGQDGDDGRDGPQAGPADRPTSSAPSPTPSATVTASASPSASARPERKRRRDTVAPEPSPTATLSSSELPEAAEITAGPPPDTSAPDEGGGSTGSWIAIGLAVLVLGAAALVPVLRRRGSGA